MRRWGLLAFLGMPFVFAACQGVAGSNAPTVEATVATPSAGPAAFAIRCSAGQLRVDPIGGPFSEPTGQHTVPLVISNISTNGCYLFGYPQVAFIDSTGHPIPFQYQTTGDQVVTSAAPRHVDLAPQGLAYVTVNKYRCDAGDLVPAIGLRFTAPGETASLDVAIAGITYCGPGDPGSTVYVSPVAATQSATLAY